MREKGNILLVVAVVGILVSGLAGYFYWFLFIEKIPLPNQTQTNTPTAKQEVEEKVNNQKMAKPSVETETSSYVRQQILEVSGDANAGQQLSFDLPIGDINSAEIMVISDQPNLFMQVNAPDGKMVESMKTSNRPVEGLPSFEGSYAAQIRLKSPRDGFWQVQLSTPTSSHYSLLVEAETSTILDAQTDLQRYGVGNPITVTARLLRGHAPLGGSQLRAELRQVSMVLQTLDLHETSTGVFQGQLRPLTQTARPEVMVTATLNTIQRQVRVPISVFEPSATIVGVRTEQLVDNDKDGKAEQLVLQVELQIARANRYKLAGNLDNPQQTTRIAYTEYKSTTAAIAGQWVLEPGQAIITLVFMGKDIYNSGINGPYPVRLILSDIDQAGVEVSKLTYHTQPYLANDFR